jgi:four helix bundle protein
MKDFRKLKVWEKAHGLAIKVYRMTSGFPRSEAFGLTAQMRGASVSIASNLAEGCGRGSDSELGRFAEIAMGSASELEYQILLAKELGYLADADSTHVAADIEEVKRMLFGLIRRLGRGRRVGVVVPATS